MKKEDELFQQGLEAFNNRQFYDAHEYWEELWLDYKLDDAQFIQGLIQLAVSYFHFYNGNINGARSMIKKCLKKFEIYESSRGINVLELKSEIISVQSYFNKTEVTDNIKDSYLISLKVIHE